MSRVVKLDLDHLIADLEISVSCYDEDTGEAYIKFDDVVAVIDTYEEGDEYVE
ncbi:MAG: hypothetical protein J6C12_03475 [Lachnospiraceae bacterium]|nr:hypothetical protein [Lachnospiraceae bacterium]